MPDYVSDGMRLHYSDTSPTSGGVRGSAVLIHGFASNGRVNWIGTGWRDALVSEGWRVVIPDLRGHGRSAAPRDSTAYPATRMADDVAVLIERLELAPTHAIGYSMGARVAAFLACRRPELLSSAIFGGMATSLLRGSRNPEGIARALEAEDVSLIDDSRALEFRRFAESTGSDLLALAACMRSPRPRITEDDLRSLSIPVLLAAGDRDSISGDPMEAAAMIPLGEGLVLEGRDHMRAVGDRRFLASALAFLGRMV